MSNAGFCPGGLLTNQFLCEGRDAYYPKIVWGGCNVVNVVKTNDCNKFLNVKNGESYLTCLNNGGDINRELCFPGTNYRVCIKNGWNQDNLIPCCAGTLNTAKDCDPNWCPGSSFCAASMREFCTANNAENITSTDCQNICRNPPDEATRGWCDTASIDYCNNNPNDVTYCGCLNADAAQSEILCFDRTCTSGAAYKTLDVQEQLDNCKINGCIIAINCSRAGTCDIDKNEFNQNCPNDTLPTNPSTTPDDPTTTTDFTIYIIIGIVIFIFLIIIFVAIYYSTSS